MLPQLLLENLVGDLHLGHLVQVVVEEMLVVLQVHLDMEEGWLRLDLAEVLWVPLVQVVGGLGVPAR